ncbi:hypothetical protein SBI_06995 [Streptomyces bingchenggensis BCW-1]|uniref:Uncharacterized protein n=1 Tax=Streptomyces bingchenggensis (strain BCW-1) TaxID=749414 RepID=D7C1Q0_STRBB|nr:hypothetical protein SBI_06995 [Streptomyces bingchenggensis BCW-1]
MAAGVAPGAARSLRRGGADVEGGGQAARHRHHPQVLLQRLQRLGQCLGDRAGPEQAGAARRTGGQRGDGAALEQPQPAVLVEAELDVLRATDHLLRAVRQARPGAARPW